LLKRNLIVAGKCGGSKITMKAAAVFTPSLLQNIKLKIGASVDF
jgi:hypothetical protein